MYSLDSIFLLTLEHAFSKNSSGLCCESRILYGTAGGGGGGDKVQYQQFTSILC